MLGDSDVTEEGKSGVATPAIVGVWVTSGPAEVIDGDGGKSLFFSPFS